MKTEQRAEVLINVHKGLRRGLLGLALKLGALDWQDQEEVKAAGADFATMLHFLREHAANEDQIQFPLLENKVSGAARREMEEHHRLDAQIDDLEKQWVRLAVEEDKSKPGYAFYLAYNRFLSDYLAHMDHEETDLTDALYQNFTDAEIEAEFKKIIARTQPADMGMMLGYMIPGMNPGERAQFLSKLQKTAPAPVFEKVKGLAQKVLSSGDWEKLSARLG